LHPGLDGEPDPALPAFWGEERQQIKWIAFAASFVGLGFVGAMVSGLIAFVFAPEAWGSTAASAPLWFDLLFSVVF
jgi:hypothetical protein